MTWVRDFHSVFVEANSTRIPSGLSVLRIASEIFGTYGMQTVDVQLRSNDVLGVGLAAEPVVMEGTKGILGRSKGRSGKGDFAKANEGFSAEGVTGMIVAI